MASLNEAGEKRLQANGLTFRVIDRGEGPAVLLLHGWPDSSYLWRQTIPVLVEAGYRVIAPDLRGLGESDRPEQVEAYTIPKILADLKEILAQLAVSRAYVVGHDWGAVVAWSMGGYMPDLVEKLVVLSVGHPGAYYAGGLEQLQMRWYMLWFLFPGVAEENFTQNDWAFFRQWLNGQGGDLEHFIEDLSRPGALTASLNWYRANIIPKRFGDQPGPVKLPAIGCPVMGVWGSLDAYLTEGQIKESGKYLKGPWRYERLEGVAHWIPTAVPERLNELLLDFLKAQS